MVNNSSQTFRYFIDDKKKYALFSIVLSPFNDRVMIQFQDSNASERFLSHHCVWQLSHKVKHALIIQW